MRLPDRRNPDGGWRLQLLNGFALSAGSLTPRISQNGQRLIAYVALNRPVTRSRAAEALWPGGDETHAQASLRTALWRVARACATVLDIDASTIRLRRGVSTDVDRLVEGAHQLRGAPTAARVPELPDIPLRAELLPGWYDEWLAASRERLRQVHLHALDGLGRQLLQSGNYYRALEAAFSAAEIDPLRETSQRLILQVHLAEGNVAEAVRSFERFSAQLRRDLGVGPSERMCRTIESSGARWDRRSLSGGESGPLVASARS